MTPFAGPESGSWGQTHIWGYSIGLAIASYKGATNRKKSWCLQVINNYDGDLSTLATWCFCSFLMDLCVLLRR